MSNDGRPQVRWQREAPPPETPRETPPAAPSPQPPRLTTRPTWRRHWPQVAIAGVLALFLLVVGLAGVSGRLDWRSPATAISAAVATAIPAATAMPAAQPVTSGACRVVLPAGFREEHPGGGYYPALERVGFVALDWPDVPAGTGADRAAQSVVDELKQVVGNFRETGADPGGDTHRVDFTGEGDGRPGRGTLYVRSFDQASCALTLFLVDGASIPFDETLQAMIETLTVVSPLPARPPRTSGGCDDHPLGGRRTAAVRVMPGVPFLRSCAAFAAAADDWPLTPKPGRIGVAARDEAELLIKRLLMGADLGGGGSIPVRAV